MLIGARLRPQVPRMRLDLNGYMLVFERVMINEDFLAARKHYSAGFYCNVSEFKPY